MRTKNLPYEKSAKFYDFIYENHSVAQYEKFLEDFLVLYKDLTGKELTSIIDYGCGTGTQAILFKKRGIDVLGVDFSEEQIKVAKEKSKQENFDIKFYQGDMASFTTNGNQFDAGAAFFSPFNYLLTDEHVLKFLESAEKNITADGLLFFEMWHSLAIDPSRQSHLVKTKDNLKLVRYNGVEFDVKTGIVSMDMHHVITDGNKVLDDFTETHLLRTYTIAQITALIKRSNWAIKKIFPGLYTEQREPEMKDFRFHVVLQKS